MNISAESLCLPERLAPGTLLVLFILTLLWGTNWPLFPLAVLEVSAWTFRAISGFEAALLLFAVARGRGLPLALPRAAWLPVSLGALFYMTVWNVASTFAANLVPSGQSAILGFTMPLWSVLITWSILGEPLGGRMLCAVALGAAAVTLGNLFWFSIVASLPPNVAGLASIMVPIIAMLASAIVHGEPLGMMQWLAMACCSGALGLVLFKPAAPASLARRGC